MRRWLTALAAGLATACASAAPPPGGMEDHAPPKLVRVTPDSNAVNVGDKVVSFQFDETINDRGSGAQELSNYFVISPSDGNEHVSWHRSRIDVRPRRGFRANTAYTVTLLPGLSDLRSNVTRSGAVITFSTGATIPTLRIQGVVFDWAAERPAARALVQAVTPDSVTYLAYTDSAGRFAVGPLPPGRYLVRAVIDANGNRAPDRNELVDSVRTGAPQAAPLELLAIARDTLPTSIRSVAPADSLSLRVTFERPLDPAAIPGSSAFRLVGPDSAAVAITAVITPKQEADEAQKVLDAKADSTRRADSVAAKGRAPTAAVPLPKATPAAAVAAKPTRPAPPTSLLLRIARPLAPATRYRLSVTEARALSGRTLSSERSFETARPAAPPAARDSAAARTSRPAPGRPVPPPDR